MTTSPQQFSELGHANVKKTLELTQIGISYAERLLSLQLGMARDLFNQNLATAKALSDVKDMQDLVELQQHFSQTSTTRIMSATRTFYEAAGRTLDDLNPLIKAQLGDFSRYWQASLDDAVASMPASSAAPSVNSAKNTSSPAVKATQHKPDLKVETPVSAAASSTKKAVRPTVHKTA